VPQEVSPGPSVAALTPVMMSVQQRRENQWFEVWAARHPNLRSAATVCKPVFIYIANIDSKRDSDGFSPVARYSIH